MKSNYGIGIFGTVSEVPVVQMCSSMDDRGTRASLITHPIKSVVVLPAIETAIFALDLDTPSFDIHCQDKGGVGRER